MLASRRANQWRGRRHKRAQVGARSSSRALTSARHGVVVRPRRAGPHRRLPDLAAPWLSWLVAPPGRRWPPRGDRVELVDVQVEQIPWTGGFGAADRPIRAGESMTTDSSRRAARRYPAGWVAVAHCAEGHRNGVFVSTDDTTTIVLVSVCTCRSRSKGFVTSQSVQLASHPKAWRILIEKATNQYRRRKSCRDSHVYWCWGPCWGR